MNITMMPSKAAGEINAPVSKSYVHRLLICAALAHGTSVIENIGLNDDITATADCLVKMGAQIDFDGSRAVVKGVDFSPKKENLNLFCNESGSTLRFLIPLSLLFAKKTEFTGKGRLMARPQSVYEQLFSERGCSLKKRDDVLVASGELSCGVYKLRGDVSSQFLTGLLFALPLLDGDSEIVLTTKLESAPYVDITIDVLSHFGIDIKRTETGFDVKGGQKYRPCNIVAEGDWSNAAFLEAFNLFGGNVTVKGLDPDSLQGDRVYREFYSSFSKGRPTFDISDCPDLGPVLIACAVLKYGAVLTGTNRLKIKESDRAVVMARELEKFGVKITVGENFIDIPNVTPSVPTENINCNNDHRIAMAFSVLCSFTGGVLQGAECVKKSYPEFFNDIKNLGIQYTIN